MVTAEVIVVDPLRPWGTSRLFGLELSEKSLPAVTVSLVEVVYVVEVPVPFTLTVYVPAGVDDDVEMVMVEPWPALIGLGLNEAEAPEGRPVVLKVTLCEEPLVTWLLMEDEALCPWAALIGPAFIVK